MNQRMNYRISDLRNFAVVAASKTMRQAAQGLEITPPALSESIARLEDDLHGKLFYRSRSGVTLTPFGRQVLDKAKLALDSLADVDDIASPRHAGARDIVIGCHPLLGAYFLPAALKRLQKEAPEARVRLRHGLSRDIQMWIQQGTVDIGLVANPLASPDLVIRKVATDTVRVWTAGGSTPEQVFCNLNLIQTQSILNKWKKVPFNRVDTDSLDLVARLTAAGLGYGILPERAAQLIAPELTPVPGTPAFKDQFALVHRPEFGRGDFEKMVILSLRASAEK